MNSRCLYSAFGMLFFGLATLAVGAAESGSIAGRIFNPATGQYVRNAEIRIEETGQTATSEGDGDFELSPVTPGRRTIVVS